MIIYPPGVYTFNGQIQEEDMQMFWVYSYKGFSRTAARTVRTALVLAGRQGCCQADTGHLLLALVRTAQAAPLRPCTGAAQGDGVCCAGGARCQCCPGRK